MENLNLGVWTSTCLHQAFSPVPWPISPQYAIILEWVAAGFWQERHKKPCRWRNKPRWWGSGYGGKEPVPRSSGHTFVSLPEVRVSEYNPPHTKPVSTQASSPTHKMNAYPQLGDASGTDHLKVRDFSSSVLEAFAPQLWVWSYLWPLQKWLVILCHLVQQRVIWEKTLQFWFVHYLGINLQVLRCSDKQIISNSKSRN